MRVDRKLLPSISMLASFDAAARTGSVSGAARELSVTHGAVSRQIHALENQLGVPLFQRTTHGLHLTEAGERYAADIRAVITTLRNASLRIIADRKGRTIDLAVLPTFGTRWLIPRLPRFIEANPDITVNFVSPSGRSGRDSDGIDVAINYGASDWPGADSRFLIGEPAYPVCAPILASRDPTEFGSVLPALPLLTLRKQSRGWTDWYAAGGIDLPTACISMECEQVSALIQAAVAGIGVALLPPFLIEAELERRSLTVLSDRPTDSEIGYYLVTPQARLEYEPVLTFRNWLIDTIDRERREPRAGVIVHGECRP